MDNNSLIIEMYKCLLLMKDSVEKSDLNSFRLINKNFSKLYTGIYGHQALEIGKMNYYLDRCRNCFANCFFSQMDKDIIENQFSEACGLLRIVKKEIDNN